MPEGLNQVISSHNAWPLLQALAPRPLPTHALAEAAHLPTETVETMLSPLVDLGVVKRAGDLVNLGFAWFTAADQDRIQTKATHAIGPKGPAIPVFFWHQDAEPIGRVVEIVKETLLSLMSDRFGTLEASLADLSPLRHGVPFAECFNPIWHTLFGHTNRILAENGFLADPEPQMAGEGRYRWWLTVYDLSQ